jgi:RNA polymerase sigma factor (sigma-70 family)
MSLIVQAQNNNPSAWELVYSLYTPLIRRWARRNGVRCSHELDNVTQEVFAKLAKNLRKFKDKRKSGGSFRGWLRRITRNHIYTNHFGEKVNSVKTVGGSEWHRMLNDIPFDNQTIKSLLDSVSEDDDEKNMIFRKIVDWVEKTYRKKMRQRIVFKRVIIDERPPKEVAKDLNVSVNVIYQTKSRILAEIREVFGELV